MWGEARPWAVMPPLSPGRADVGGSVRTTVASAYGVPSAANRLRISSRSSAILFSDPLGPESGPHLVRTERHVDVGDAVRRQGVDQRVDVGRRRSDCGGLADALGAKRVMW